MIICFVWNGGWWNFWVLRWFWLCGILLGILQQKKTLLSLFYFLLIWADAKNFFGFCGKTKNLVWLFCNRFFVLLSWISDEKWNFVWFRLPERVFRWFFIFHFDDIWHKCLLKIRIPLEERILFCWWLLRVLAILLWDFVHQRCHIGCRLK